MNRAETVNVVAGWEIGFGYAAPGLSVFVRALRMA
jgi:hypothetical protein